MQTRKSTITILICAVAFAATPARSAIVNGGFESGNFTGWSTTGDASIVTSSFGSGPIGGTYEALVEGGAAGATIPALETFIGVTGGSLDALGNGITHGGSALKQTFTATAGQTLTFSWNFITDEAPPSIFDDFAFFSVNSVSTLASANAATLVPFGGVLQTGFQQRSLLLPAGGSYTLTLGVANVSDTGGLPQLLVDNVTLTTAVPEPSYGRLFALIGTAAVAINLLKRRPNRAQITN